MKKLVLLMMTAAAVLSFTGCGDTEQSEANDPASEENGAAEPEDLIIPVSGISETASFYPVTVDGTEMEVLAIKDSSGNIRTAFNTCQSCYTSGNGRYEAEGTELVCQNCGIHFTAEQVGIESKDNGCNPWPITDEHRTITADSIEIPYEFLKESRDIFANW
ncbi:MAG: Fe-S-containing protein [Porcipelethomonas sp.]